jgi:hypothetical protein
VPWNSKDMNIREESLEPTGSLSPVMLDSSTSIECPCISKPSPGIYVHTTMILNQKKTQFQGFDGFFINVVLK